MKWWTHEEDALLIELWSRGFSQRRIAEEINQRLGSDRNRMMVGGRIKRLRDEGVSVDRRSKPVFLRSARGQSIGSLAPRVSQWGRYISAGQVPMPRVEIGGRMV